MVVLLVDVRKGAWEEVTWRAAIHILVRGKEKHCIVKITSCLSFAAGMCGIVFAGGMLPVCPC